METTKPEYISAVDTAKLIRKVLKADFPETKFSVRTSKYSGGASIRVHWTDGPTKEQVEARVKPFAGSGFDGMIDMAYSKRAWLLPSGRATFGQSNGTEYSAGVYKGYEHPKPHPEARFVHFLADYVFCERRLSVDLIERAAAVVREEYEIDPDDMPAIAPATEYFGARAIENNRRPYGGSVNTIADVIHERAHWMEG